MLNYLTVDGPKARKFYVEERSIGNMKSMIRAVGSGSVLIIPTKFKFDIIYSSKEDKNESIIKLWSLYLGRSFDKDDLKCIKLFSGNKESLTGYFQSLTTISKNTLRINFYLRTFRQALASDIKNEIALKLIECDSHVIANHKRIGSKSYREPLSNQEEVSLKDYSLNSLNTSILSIQSLISFNRN